jgi:hypothetical protein
MADPTLELPPQVATHLGRQAKGLSMRSTIAAHTECALPQGDQVVAYFNFSHDDGDDVIFTARGRNGEAFEIAIAPADWARIRQEIAGDGAPAAVISVDGALTEEQANALRRAFIGVPTARLQFLEARDVDPRKLVSAIRDIVRSELRSQPRSRL